MRVYSRYRTLVGLSLISAYNKMNYGSTPVLGSILDRPVDPMIVLLYVTDRPHGPPIKKKTVPKQEEHKPVDLGEERHHQLLSAIKGLKVDQNVKQSAVTESLEQFRDWRR